MLVALAGIGGTPVNNNAGKAMKLPPPATEFSAPPSAPAKNRKMIVFGVKLLGVPESTPDRQPSVMVTIVTCKESEVPVETSKLLRGY